MSTAAQAAPTLPAPPYDLPLQCTCCGSVHLESMLVWRPWPDLGLEIAECRCGTTLSREPPVDVVAEHRRAEGEELLYEERGEHARAWAARSW